MKLLLRARRLKPILFLTAAMLLSAHSYALNILMVNDDGCTAPGINVLADALQAAGHTVSIYAPASNQSGQGSRITVSSRGCRAINFAIKEVDLDGTKTSAKNRHCVSASISGCSAPFPPPFTADNQTASASPFESALVGLELLSGKNSPDVVISGINQGENLGAVINNSGTVNAAVAAIRNGIPGIAVSLGIPAPNERYADVAKLIVGLLDRLQKEANGGDLLPPYTGLNINYPGHGIPKGILLTKVGTFSTAVAGPRLQADGSMAFGATIDMTPKGLPADKIHDEGIAIREGYISISAIDGDWGASRSSADAVKAKLKGIQP